MFIFIKNKLLDETKFINRCYKMLYNFLSKQTFYGIKKTFKIRKKFLWFILKNWKLGNIGPQAQNGS